MRLIKNRLFVSVVLSLFCLLLSFGVCVQRHISISFQIDAQKDTEIQVFYQDEPNTKFSGKKSVSHQISSGNSKVNIRLPISHIYRIRLDFGRKPGTVMVRDFVLHANPSVKLNVTDFQERNIESFVTENDKIVLMSSSEDPYITYRPKLDSGSDISIDWCVLFILACFYFFAFYKLYPHFPTVYRILRRPHGMLVFGFFVLLCVPMLHISDDKQSETENRMLAQRPHLFVSGSLNRKFGAEFDAWFNDRFLGRDTMINISSNIKYLLSQHYYYAENRVYYDDWLFSDLKSAARFMNTAQASVIKDSIDVFNKWCSENGIICYIEIVPRRLDFAKNKIFRHVTEPDTASVLYEYLTDKGVKNLIFPSEELQAANKTDMVYFKTDHHWTEYGAYIGYQALMQRLKSDFPEIKSVSDKDYDTFYNNMVRSNPGRNFINGHHCNRLLLDNKCPLNVPYKYYKHHRTDEIKEQENVEIRQKEYEFNAPNKQKIVVVGNSFAENMMQFVPYTFSKTKKIRWNTPAETNIKMSRWNKEILDYKPDILLILLESESVHRLKDLKD